MQILPGIMRLLRGLDVDVESDTLFRIFDSFDMSMPLSIVVDAVDTVTDERRRTGRGMFSGSRGDLDLRLMLSRRGDLDTLRVRSFRLPRRVMLIVLLRVIRLSVASRDESVSDISPLLDSESCRFNPSHSLDPGCCSHFMIPSHPVTDSLRLFRGASAKDSCRLLRGMVMLLLSALERLDPRNAAWALRTLRSLPHLDWAAFCRLAKPGVPNRETTLSAQYSSLISFVKLSRGCGVLVSLDMTVKVLSAKRYAFCLGKYPY